MNEKLPEFVYVGGILGLVMLAISILIFCVYMALYNKAYDTNVTLERHNLTEEEKYLMISYIVIGILGFLLCLCIPYGHYIKSFYDPAVVSTKNTLHFETVNPEKQKIEAIDIVKPSEYSLVGTRGSEITAKGSNKFSTKDVEDYL